MSGNFFNFKQPGRTSVLRDFIKILPRRVVRFAQPFKFNKISFFEAAKMSVSHATLYILRESDPPNLVPLWSLVSLWGSQNAWDSWFSTCSKAIRNKMAQQIRAFLNLSHYLKLSISIYWKLYRKKADFIEEINKVSCWNN